MFNFAYSYKKKYFILSKTRCALIMLSSEGSDFTEDPPTKQIHFLGVSQLKNTFRLFSPVSLVGTGISKIMSQFPYDQNSNNFAAFLLMIFR